jgi:hypothetical protein
VRKGADKRLEMLQKGLRPMGVDFRPESYKWSIVQVQSNHIKCKIKQLLKSGLGSVGF